MRFPRYCVLLITSEEESFDVGNKAFLSMASANTNEALRFAYVYQRQQQPLCDALLRNRDSGLPQVRSTLTGTTIIEERVRPAVSNLGVGTP